MNVIVKYKVEKAFRDKYTKEEIKKDDVIDITIDRMKELNGKSIGRAIDVLVIMDNDEEVETKPNEQNNEETKEESDKQDDEETQEKDEKIITDNSNIKFTKEELDTMTVNQLKDLAEKNGIELTKAKKTEIIEEIMSN